MEVPVELQTPATAEELSLFAAQEQASSSVAAFALSADPMLWAVALTGLQLVPRPLFVPLRYPLRA